MADTEAVRQTDRSAASWRLEAVRNGPMEHGRIAIAHIRLTKSQASPGSTFPPVAARRHGVARFEQTLTALGGDAWKDRCRPTSTTASLFSSAFLPWTAMKRCEQGEQRAGDELAGLPVNAAHAGFQGPQARRGRRRLRALGTMRVAGRFASGRFRVPGFRLLSGDARIIWGVDGLLAGSAGGRG